MLAIELSGIHIGRKIKITYRYKSWSKSREDKIEILRVCEVHHYENGDVKVDWGRGHYPFNAEVELLD